LANWKSFIYIDGVCVRFHVSRCDVDVGIYSIDTRCWLAVRTVYSDTNVHFRCTGSVLFTCFSDVKICIKLD